MEFQFSFKRHIYMLVISVLFFGQEGHLITNIPIDRHLPDGDGILSKMEASL